MARESSSSDGARGQFLVLFALASTAIILLAGLTIDGGYAFAQRRGSQNASDFAALAGARVVAEWVDGNTTDGTDANVRDAISNSIQANGASAITFGSPNGPVYISKNGTPNGFVGAIVSGKIPTGTVGVKVSSSKSWQPFFLGVIGVSNWTASSTATAKGGYSIAGPPGRHLPGRHLAGDLSELSTLLGRHRQLARMPARPSDPGQPECPGWVRLAEVRGGRQVHRFRTRDDQCRVRQLEAIPPVGDRAAIQQLRLLHGRGPGGQRGQDRQPPREQGER